jgi:branched-chain amino acid transport system substrate-binding protein
MYLWGASPATGIIVAQARQLGLSAHILAGGGILSDAFLKVAGRGADGLYTMSQSNFTHPNAREFAFDNAYHARFNARPTNFAVNGWNAVHVVRAALAAVPDGDTAKLVAWFERMPTYEGTMPIRFSPTDHDGGRTLVPAVAKNGVWYTL